MGMKFEYTLNGLDTHWDADHFAGFTCEDVYGSLKVAKAGNRTTVPLPPWEEAMKDKLMPIISMALTAAILEAVRSGSTVLVIVLPSWIPAAVLVIILADIARRQIWKGHPESKLMNIRILCPDQEVHDTLAAHFQGTWEL